MCEVTEGLGLPILGFVIVDMEDNDAPIITVRFHEKKYRTQVIDDIDSVVDFIALMMKGTRHPYLDNKE